MQNSHDPLFPDELLLNFNTPTEHMIPQELLYTLNALIVTDFHFNQKHLFHKSGPSIFKYILKIVTRHKCNAIFVLGDNIQQNQDKIGIAVGNAMIQAFQEIGLPTFIIGGNHDRNAMKYCKVNPVKPLRNVTIITEDCIKLVHPNPPPNTPPIFWMGHDFCNNFRLNDSDIIPFLLALKHRIKTIAPEDYLLIGHVHRTVIINEDNVSCLAPLSMEASGPISHSYAILTSEHGFSLEFFTSVD